MTAATQSDDRPDAVSTEQLRTQIQRRLHPDAVENQARPPGASDLLDSLSRLRDIAVVHDVVGAECLRVLQFRVIDVAVPDQGPAVIR